MFDLNPAMFKNKQSSLVFLFFGDVIAFYASLTGALALRYGFEFQNSIDLHLTPFSVVALLWFIVLYAGGLYDPRKLRNNIDFFKTFSIIVGLNTLLPYFILCQPLALLPEERFSCF
jgi:hypothetical protein